MAYNNRTRTQTDARQPQAKQADPFQPRQDQPPATQSQPQQPPPPKPKPSLTEALERRGIDDATWRTLCNSVFPGALTDSILMAVDYCRARKLDVLKKPCHIVPMEVEEKKRREDGSVQRVKVWRDVILPGIYEYRITARRTGEYCGRSKPVFGPLIDFHGLQAPAYCELTIYRWNEKLQDKVGYEMQVFFTEVVAMKDGHANRKWTQSPHQMVFKCTEAAGLREAFPDELGGLPSAEEMEGRRFEELQERTRGKPATQAPRATNGHNGETTGPSDETEAVDAETTEASGETGGPSAAEASGTYATADQVTHIRKLLDATGIPENETCGQFEVGALEDLLFEQVAGVVAWIDRVSKG